MRGVLGVWARAVAHLALRQMRRRGGSVIPSLGHRRRGGPGHHPAHSPGWSWIHSSGVTPMVCNVRLEKPHLPMRIDDLLVKLTCKGYIKGPDMLPPDENGICAVHGPKDGVAHWRTRALWQELFDEMDYISIYPCTKQDPAGDTFIFVLFNPRNGVVEQWRIAEHWTGDEFIVRGCSSLDMALSIHANWLMEVTNPADYD